MALVRVWPELTAVAQMDLRDDQERLTVLIVYALAEMQREGRAPTPPEDLLKLMRAAGDPTRLERVALTDLSDGLDQMLG